MSELYDFKNVESKWQRIWDEAEEFEVEADPGRPKFYCLEMLPYSSGNIHMGHVRNYSIGDAIARYHLRRGRNVLHPIGFDSLGLPAENAAIKHGTHPKAWTEDSVASMTTQLKSLGFAYPWNRVVKTYQPEYYRWNQWIFLRMHERGLVYRSEQLQNWCPECRTVLANEQNVGGYCWRHSETPVVQRKMPAWFLRITAYAQELLDGLQKLEGAWPEQVLTMQHNWIGRSAGTRLRFEMDGLAERLEAFTTRVDTIYGATFIVMSPEHPLLPAITAGTGREAEVEAFASRLREQVLTEEEMQAQAKEGVYTGRDAINPFTGERMQIWVGNFVLMGFGTGAIFAVPAHDQRDFEFARQYGQPIRPVIETADGGRLRAEEMTEAMVEHGRLFNSGPYDGLATAEAIEALNAEAQRRGVGGAGISWRLRDWGISRQRYWGTPIPMIHCRRCGIVPVPDDHLPVLLPEQYVPEGEGSPLERVVDWASCRCPGCGEEARRETDTMDTFFDSSWYHLRYTSPRELAGPFDREAAAHWMPVDIYVGGIEHAVLHLMYFRFFHKFLRDVGLVTGDEPAARLFTQGMVVKDGAKMSKSKGNVVEPVDLIERHGADAVRMFMLFAAPPAKQIDWIGESGIEGMSRFLNRLWRLAAQGLNSGDANLRLPPVAELGEEARALVRRTHQTIRRVSEDIESRIHHNTAIAAVMELVNAASALQPGGDGDRAARWEAIVHAAHLVYPFAPHFAEELNERLGGSERLTFYPWPEYNAELAAEEMLTVVVQVNGKLRATIEVPAGTEEERIKAAAQAEEKVQTFTAGKAVRKIIYVPGKLVNIVAT